MATEWEDKDDAYILGDIRLGSYDAFAALVHRHSTRFYAVAYRMLTSRQDAEDIVQEAFLKLWERPDSWQPEKNVKFTTWFYRVVVNLCLDKLKRKSALPMLEDVEFADSGIMQDDLVAEKEDQKLLEKEIAALPERQRTALNLCFYENLSNQEAADVMQINLKALQSLVMRAKTTLKEKFNLYRSGKYASGQ